MEKMENVFEEQKRQLPLYLTATIDTIETHTDNSKSHNRSKISVTPTDVQDVEF